MESGNSSSMQSSSGGDDQDYESSAPVSNNYLLPTNISATTTTATTNTNTATGNNTANMFMFSQHQNNYLQPFPDSSFNQNVFWQHQQTQQIGINIINPDLPALTPPRSASAGGGGVLLSDQQTVPAATTTTKNKASTSGSGPGTSKNSRKRTRASRRAPTTVLTTDTTNFRAMVQEFTGIPSSPFSAAASPLLSRRLNDLFAPSPITALGLMGPTSSSHLRPVSGSGAGGYPFRPAPQKPPPPLPSQIPGFHPKNPGMSSGLNLLDPFQLSTSAEGSSSSNIRYPLPGLFTSTTNNINFNELIIGNDQMFLSTNQDAFPGVRLTSDGNNNVSVPWRSDRGTNDHNNNNNEEKNPLNN